MAVRDRAVLRTILTDTRINEYEAILRQALESGYAVLGVHGYWSQQPERCLILRHDVDLPESGLREMLEVERRFGVSATWYFRWQTATADLVQLVRDARGEVGLHYESLALLCQEQGITTPGGVTAAVRAAVLSRLAEEIGRFREQFKVPCRSIASHGHPHNRKLRVANNELVTPETYGRLDIDVEAYDRALLKGLTYLCDATLTVNRGWAYGLSPQQAMAGGDERILFLSHPHHWQLPWPERLKAMSRWILFGVSEAPAEFRRTFQG